MTDQNYPHTPAPSGEFTEKEKANLRSHLLNVAVANFEGDHDLLIRVADDFYDFVMERRLPKP